MTNAVSLAQQASTGVSQGFKNRIINGAMVIDQRNAGASSSSSSNGVYFLDRWAQNNNNGSARFTVQQNAGSVTPPAGFTNYLGVTSTGAYSITGNDILSIFQRIEGFNTADLMWGTANAQTVTLSFWVRSSLTGTFGGSLLNFNGSRSYPFSYIINSANTWEQKSITIAGDTTGTWLTTNGVGINVYFSLGTVSAFSGTAGSWSASGFYSATGATSVVGTNGATFYITGVQLEVGSTATSFDYRPYGTELALCQRYYEIIGDAVGGSTSQAIFADSYAAVGSTCQINWIYRQQKRAAPTVATYGTFTFLNGTAIIFSGNNSVLSVCVIMQPTSATAQRSYFLNNAASGVYASSEL